VKARWAAVVALGILALAGCGGSSSHTVASSTGVRTAADCKVVMANYADALRTSGNVPDALSATLIHCGSRAMWLAQARSTGVPESSLASACASRKGAPAVMTAACK